MNRVHVIFEDNESVPSSQCLRYCLDDAVTIHFTGGNTRVLKEIQDCIEKGADSVVVYFDTPPNNRKAMKSFLSTQDTFAQDDRVMFIPLLCLESILFKTLSDSGKIRVLNQRTAEEYYRVLASYEAEGNWMEVCKAAEYTSQLFCKSNEHFRSIEGIYKRMFREFVEDCQKNRIKEGHGSYYIQDCKCASCAGRESLYEKSQNLWKCLPYAPTGVIKSANRKSVKYMQVKEERQSWFDKQASRLNVPTYQLYLDKDGY